MSRDHRRLRVFQSADRLVLSVYETTAGLPASEQFGLQTQIRRAAISTVANIVEGAGRPTTREYCRFLHVAHSSARDAGYLIGLADRLGLFGGSQVQDLVSDYGQLAAALLATVHGLQRTTAPDTDPPEA